MIFKFQVIDGRIEYLNRPLMIQFMKGLKDGKYALTLEKDHPRRTSSENRYYWGVVLKLISESTGYTPEECHAIFKDMFNSYEKNGRRFSKSTTKLKTVEFENYLEKIRRFAATDLLIYIPNPNERCPDDTMPQA